MPFGFGSFGSRSLLGGAAAAPAPPAGTTGGGGMYVSRPGRDFQRILDELHRELQDYELEGAPADCTCTGLAAELVVRRAPPVLRPVQVSRTLPVVSLAAAPAPLALRAPTAPQPSVPLLRAVPQPAAAVPLLGPTAPTPQTSPVLRMKEQWLRPQPQPRRRRRRKARPTASS
jgi:hypothetical protein